MMNKKSQYKDVEGMDFDEITCPLCESDDMDFEHLHNDEETGELAYDVACGACGFIG